ncbi:MAG: trypsin-like peptidase domain-containing protein [Ignavibacteria bacterium]|jgi:tetratricopeptide (TPR) repeat protein
MRSIIFSILTALSIFLNNNFLYSQDAEQILESNKPALVSIWTFDEAYFNEIKKEYSFDTLVIWGSGFIVSGEGFVATCYHVISNIDTIIVKTSNGTFFPASIISCDTINDLALLKIHAGETDSFQCITMGNSDELKTGEAIYTIGSPMGYEYSISQGIISGIRDNAEEYLDGEQVVFERVIQTDAAVSPGNSGGAFFNSMGEVIGITSYNYLAFGNLNFGVAINCFKKLMPLNDTGSPSAVVMTPKKINERIKNFLEVASALKKEIKTYCLFDDSSRKNLYARASSLPDDTSTSGNNVDRDSLNNIYIHKTESYYKKCFSLDSAYFDTYDDLIDFYLKIRKPEKAEEVYNNARRIFKDDPQLQYLTKSLETYYLRLKNFGEIKKLYGMVEGKDDVKADVFYKLGTIYEDIGDSVNALKQYKLAIKKEPEFYRAYFQLGKYYYRSGYYSKAKSLFDKAYEYRLILDLKPGNDRALFKEDTYSDFDLHYYLGMISLKVGDKLAALLNYMKLVPSNNNECEKVIKLYKNIIK